MAVAGEQILTRLGFEVDEISLKSSLEKVAAFGSALRRAFADASAALVGVVLGRKAPGLVEDRIVNRHLADIVQRRS